ncbi:MAG: tetratricopeptide repeat protein [Candidatus Poribacteria bacterium]|nr:tetratricopeptide repeat protein [Candidatus Poribacteria bacterium]
MLTISQTQQLNALLDTVKEMTADSITAWHQSLAEEVQEAVGQIERLTVESHQASLVQQMLKTLERQEQAILNALELPLRTLRKLAESGHLNDAQKAKLLTQLGNMHDLLTQWDIALDQFYRALDYCQDNLPQKAATLKALGRLKSKQRDYSEGNSHYRDALAIYSELGDQYQVAQIYINLGWNDFQSDNYPSAESNYQQALDIAQSTTGAERLVADAQMNLAILATVKGEFDTAISYYEKSTQTYVSINEERGLAQAYYNMAMLYVDTKAWQQAGEAYQTSLEYAQRQSNLHLMGHIYLSYTELALKLSDLALAQACCMHAVKVFGRIGGNVQLAEAYKFAGEIQRRQHNLAKAERFFERGLKLAEMSESRLNIAEVHYEYGMMLMEKPDADSAKHHLNEAIRIFTTLEAAADIEKAQTALASLAKPEAATATKRRFRQIKQS